jgi:hypothetical protein
VAGVAQPSQDAGYETAHASPAELLHDGLAHVWTGLTKRGVLQFGKRVRHRWPGDDQRTHLSQDRPQPHEGTRQTRLDRPASHAQDLRRLCLGEVEEVAVGQHQAVALGQLEQRPQQGFATLLR